IPGREPPSGGWPPKPALAAPFADVREEHWAAGAVRALHADWGIGTAILAGSPKAALDGDRLMVRAEFPVVLQRILQVAQRWVDLLSKQPLKKKDPLSPQCKSARPRQIPSAGRCEQQSLASSTDLEGNAVTKVPPFPSCRACEAGSRRAFSFAA